MTDIVFSHANGFPYDTYRHFLSLLAPHTVTGVPKLGHGAFKPLRNWYPLVDELIAHIETHHTQPVAGVGHSLGGVLTFWAAIRRPDLFEKVIILDSPMFSIYKRIPLWVAQKMGISGKIVPPAKKTRHRRTEFASKEEALHFFERRALFKHFDPQSLRDYVEYGLVPTEKGFTLSFSAEMEYRLFCQTPAKLGKKEPQVPSYFLYATTHQVLQPNDVEWLKRALKSTTFLPIEGGHMFPLEQPEHAAALLKQLIAE